MNLIIVVTTIILFILVDLYIYQAVKKIPNKWPSKLRNTITYLYWGLTVATSLALIIFSFIRPEVNSKVLRNFILLIVSLNYIPKLFSVVILMLSDILSVFKWLGSRFFSKDSTQSESNGKLISRSEFLVKTAIVGAGIPFVTFGFGILSGAYDYRVRRISITVSGLSKKFDGITIGQISDIHSGSFFGKKAVQGGVELLNSEKPDIYCFTGDLVNVETSEVEDYISVFRKVNAPLAKFAITGNHDYGDYRSWPSINAKRKNFKDLIEAHRILGWDLLMNENRTFIIDNESLAFIGIENWGTGRFPKYGDLAKAYEGTEGIPAKILLSHDPSHWEAQVLKDYPDINLVLAGHTHGFQFGVEWGKLRWSPAQYRYNQWAGLYTRGDQYIYVNRGFGFIGYPGRVGIPPEITVIELKTG